MVVTVRAEFSSIIYVVVEPSIATTRLVAPVQITSVMLFWLKDNSSNKETYVDGSVEATWRKDPG